MFDLFDQEESGGEESAPNEENLCVQRARESASEGSGVCVHEVN